MKSIGAHSDIMQLLGFISAFSSGGGLPRQGVHWDPMDELIKGNVSARMKQPWQVFFIEYLASDQAGWIICWNKLLLSPASLMWNLMLIFFFSDFRKGLLRHISIEEKIVFPTIAKCQGRDKIALTDRLHIDHAAIVSLMVPPPSLSIIQTLKSIFAVHNPLKENDGGLYDLFEASVGADIHMMRGNYGRSCCCRSCHTIRNQNSSSWRSRQSNMPVASSRMMRVSLYFDDVTARDLEHTSRFRLYSGTLFIPDEFFYQCSVYYLIVLTIKTVQTVFRVRAEEQCHERATLKAAGLIRICLGSTSWIPRVPLSGESKASNRSISKQDKSPIVFLRRPASTQEFLVLDLCSRRSA